MPVTMAGTGIDIRRWGGGELWLGIGASAAVCRHGELQHRGLAALFCRELGRRPYGAADCRSGVDHAATRKLV